MKGAVAALVLAGASMGPAHAAPPDDPTGETLIALEKRSWEAWKARDAKFFQDVLADDHLDVGFFGPVGKAAVVAGVASPACEVKSYALDKFRVNVIDSSTALVVYWAEQDTLCGGTAVPSPAWVSSLYSKRGGRWVNVLFQQTQTPKTQAR